jgi:hypothetical protein
MGEPGASRFSRLRDKSRVNSSQSAGQKLRHDDAEAVGVGGWGGG